MTPEAERRLVSHVRSIVATAGVPPDVADDITEEMLGHLIRRSADLMAAGADEAGAVRTAIADFGGTAEIGREMARTYHGRLWQSTVGTLMLARDGERRRPAAVEALRMYITFVAVLAIPFGVIALVSETPIRAIAAAAAVCLFVGVSALAHRGLEAGQDWALRLGIGLATVMVVSGLVDLARSPAGTTTVPVGGLAAAGILAWLAGTRAESIVYFAQSRAISPRLGLGLGAALLGPVAVASLLPVVPDPTQARPTDVAMTLRMTCGRSDEQIPDGPLVPDQQFATVTVDLLWHRSDILPRGLRGVVAPDMAGDTAGFRLLEPSATPIEGGGALPVWMLGASEPAVTVVETGEVAGWFGSTSPSAELIPDTLGSFTVGVSIDRIQAGRTIRIQWDLRPARDGTQAWPVVEVAYAHLDRFVLVGDVSCGRETIGSADREPAPAQPGLLP